MEPQPPQREIVEQPSDDQLIARANAGDAAAFEALYLRYRDWVMHLALRFARSDRDLALDVVQEVFLEFLRKFPGFTLTAQLKTYLFPVVRHTTIGMLAKRGRAAIPFPEGAGPGKQMERIALEQAAAPAPVSARSTESDSHLTALRAAVDALDAGQREVVLLRFADDLSLQEIALAMEIPLGTVKSRLHHALAALRADPRLRDFFDVP